VWPGFLLIGLVWFLGRVEELPERRHETAAASSTSQETKKDSCLLTLSSSNVSINKDYWVSSSGTI